MKYIKSIIVIVTFILSFSLSAQQRKIVNIPDIPGFKTLKCDFHMHTVFSDGTVWPTIRVAEAWLEGLDVISITDHIEYLPHSKDIQADHNRSYEIALPAAKRQGLLLIKAAEITRSMPPGHINALFIKNANLLELEDVDDALQEAKDQGAFLLWNHPGWKAQQPDTTLWWDKHTQLLKKGLINGIEVYNNNEYYPEAFEWSIEKKLAVFCNTDVHGPINMSYDLSESHRPMTLVFAKEKSKKSIKEALFARRSVAFFENTLMGPAKYLDPLFFASIVIGPKSVQLTNKGISLMNITNNSDIDYELDLLQPSVGFTSPEKIFLKAHHTTRIELSGNSEEIDKFEKLYLYYSVANMYTAPDSNLIVTLSVNNF